MGFNLVTILGIVSLAFIAEVLDSSLGMLYSTLTTSLLIILGFLPLSVIPAVLFSQAVGGFIASRLHYRLKTLDFSFKFKDPRILWEKIKKFGLVGAIIKGISENLKVQVLLVSLGLLSPLFAALVAVNISAFILKTYIGIVIFVLGILILKRIKYQFSWFKMFLLSLFASFNAGLTGAGFGVITTSGQVISGREVKESIVTTVLAEFPISLVAFFSYWILNGIQNWSLVFLLCLGNILGAVVGPRIMLKTSPEKLKKFFGIVVVLLGFYILIKTWSKFAF